jgi:tRNA A37 threonylcarbamoyladenosine modification protein TsaB
VLACNAPLEATNLIVVLDAKRGQIFTARFERDGAILRVVEEAHLDTLAAMLARSPRPVWLLGEGIDYHRGEIPEMPDVFIVHKSLWRARAAAAGKLGREMARSGEFADPMTLSPRYIRVPEAEAKADARAAARLHDAQQ